MSHRQPLTAAPTVALCRGRRHKGAATGVSIVELLVGMAVGLLIAAGALNFLASNLRENRNLLLEGRLMQDLRTASDVITRDLRRAGYWGGAEAAMWPAAASAPRANPYAAIATGAEAADGVTFQYSRDAIENDRVDASEQLGFRLRNGSLEMQLGADNWQALTDNGLLLVTAFNVTPLVQDVVLSGFCTSTCPPLSTTCPPHLHVRSLVVQISGRSVADSNVSRSLRTSVRLRNDSLVGACAA
jgi:prepilin peptidase dependent protein B